MKLKIITLLSLSCFSLSISAQSYQFSEYNNVKARINSNGVLFEDEVNGQPAYFVPKTGTNSSIYSMSFWFGGYDATSNLHLCAQKYGNMLDMYSGPIANDYANTAYQNKFVDNIWTVNAIDISTHLQNYNTPNYVVPNVIGNWPAHGDISNGEAANIAPFIDVNHNGIYDPIHGDYPNIRGDEATFLILNDAAGIHNSSSGDALGMEFHYMIYQYATNDNVNNTTFINLKVINRSSETYTNFKVGQFVDADLGYASDDLYGCDSVKQIIYTYNGDNDDTSPGNNSGFGTPPPAIGVKLLNQNMDVAGFFNGVSVAPQTNPTIASQYWGYMNAEWGNSGQHFTKGGTGIGGSTNTNFLMYSNPNEALGWSEINETSIPGDRRMFMVSDGQTISPNQYICYDFAIISAQGTSNLQSVDSLYSVADQIQSFYDNQMDYTCESVVLNIENKNKIEDITIYPNPSSGDFTIMNMNNITSISIYTIEGKILKTYEINNQPSIKLNLNDLDRGVYFLRYNTNDSFAVKKITIN